MPDISKINALAIGSVSKVDGLAKASILDINGITVNTRNPDAPTSGFLFTYSGGAAAYSVRQLNNNAPYVMRVRRVTGVGNTGNDDEADVKFDTTLTPATISLDSPVNNFSQSGSNATTLGEFLNVGTVGSTTYTDVDSLSPYSAAAYAVTWFDLTGNQNHAEQATPGSQPQIHDGTVDTDLITKNGKPSLSFDGSGDNLQYTGNFLGGAAATGVSVSSFDNATRTAREIMWGAQDSSGGRYDFLITRQASNAGSGTTQNGIDIYVEGDFSPPNNPNVGTITDSNQHLYTAIYSDTVRRIVYNNGSTLTTSSATSLGNLTDATAFVIGADISGGINSIDGQIQEIVIWNADQEADTNRTGIETDVNTYFSIY